MRVDNLSDSAQERSVSAALELVSADRYRGYVLPWARRSAQ